MKIRTTLWSVCLFLITATVMAQYTEVINSNRPGLSHSAFSVGQDVLQFEAGAYIVNEEHSRLKYDVAGGGGHFTIRYGQFFEQLEFNIEGMYQNDVFTDNRSAIPQETDRANFREFAIGAKYLVYDPFKNAADEKPNLYSWKANNRFKWKSLLPAVAIYGGVNIDAENNPYTAPDVEGISPKVMIITQNNFDGGWVFVLNFIKDRIGSDYSDFQYIVTLTKSIGQRWAIFGEAHGIKGDFYAYNLMRFGGGYLWNKNFQVDAAVTLNTKDTPSVFQINAGISYRFDWHKDPTAE